jgi:hypothetical protein
MTKKVDNRPICDCPMYRFPHRVGGKCKGSYFTDFHFTYVRSECEFCNCNAGDHCDVSTGQESIKEAECYRDAVINNPAEHLPLFLVELDPSEY